MTDSKQMIDLIGRDRTMTILFESLVSLHNHEKYLEYIGEVEEKEDYMEIINRANKILEFGVNTGATEYYLRSMGKIFNPGENAVSQLTKKCNLYKDLCPADDEGNKNDYIPRYLFIPDMYKWEYNSDYVARDTFDFSRNGDILSGFTLKNYDVGDEFEIHINGTKKWGFTLTEEMKNKLIKPLYDELPHSLVSSAYSEFTLRCLNRKFDQPIDVYYLLAASTDFRLSLTLAKDFNFEVAGKEALYEKGWYEEK